jgi:hypothetical protein
MAKEKKIDDMTTLEVLETLYPPDLAYCLATDMETEGLGRAWLGDKLREIMTATRLTNPRGFLRRQIETAAPIAPDPYQGMGWQEIAACAPGDTQLADAWDTIKIQGCFEHGRVERCTCEPPPGVPLVNWLPGKVLADRKLRVEEYREVTKR